MHALGSAGLHYLAVIRVATAVRFAGSMPMKQQLLQGFIPPSKRVCLNPAAASNAGTPVKKDNGSCEEASPSMHTPEASSPPPSATSPLYSQPLPGALSPRTRTRVAANKDAALARRHLRMAEQKTAESRVKGLSFPDLSDLLLEPGWVSVLSAEFKKPYVEQLTNFIQQEAAGKFPIYPPAPLLFNAFNSCAFRNVKVVVLGQDPYHGPGQAMGLSFSVPPPLRPPSSLINIFKELHSDLGCPIPQHGSLDKWAAQGVLLLNTVLTVRDHQANSHAKKGWEPFTDAAIRQLALQREGVVFLLWGAHAQEKGRMIDSTRHRVLKAPHPSGLSAHRGFFGCRHFSKTNEYLEASGKPPIDWNVA